MANGVEHGGNDIQRTLDVLAKGELREAQGLLPWGSNYTLLMTICHEGIETPVVYKPRRGERPLWDFPDGTLCQRETAAFVVSESLGWHIVPPTLMRDGPHGIGMVQLFIGHDPDQHYFTFGHEQRENLQRIATFDLIINNADRKGGHCLLAEDGKMWGIDHGICFHARPKLRTVIWEFAGMPIPQSLVSDVGQLLDTLNNGSVATQLGKLLNEEELTALRSRMKGLLRRPVFPAPTSDWHYPWPPV